MFVARLTAFLCFNDFAKVLLMEGFSMSTLRSQVTERIILSIEAGAPPWRPGWSMGRPHQNLSTGKAYKGINQLLLAMAPYADPRWMTFKQATLAGCKVKKGEHGTRIIKMVEVMRNRVNQGDDTEILGVEGKKALVMKAYTVFNAQQLEGAPPMEVATSNVEPVSAVEAIAEGLMKTTGLVVTVEGNQPCYIPARDIVKMPASRQFHAQGDWAACFLHELAHATGHRKRMNRPDCFARFGSELYAKEELRAELGAAMVSCQLGLPMGQTQIDSHAAYVSSWLQVLRRDKNEIFRAAADAQRIADYLETWIPKPEADSASTPQQQEIQSVELPKRFRF